MSQIFKIRFLANLPRFKFSPSNYQYSRSSSIGFLRHYSKAADSQNSEKDDEPISYLNSEAATWEARKSRTFGTDEMLWYQPLVVSASLIVFLVYFCVLREENDIDQELSLTLYDRIPGLEEKQLESAREFYVKTGVDVAAIDQRLKEIKENAA